MGLQERLLRDVLCVLATAKTRDSVCEGSAVELLNKARESLHIAGFSIQH